MRLQLLEGERVHRVVRRHPLCHLSGYAIALALLGYAALLALLFLTGFGTDFARGFDAAGPLAVPLLLAVWWAGLAAVLGPFAVRRRVALPLAYGVAVAVAGGFAAVLLQLPKPTALGAAMLLPWLTLAAVPAPLVVAELRRRSEVWVLTNFRLLRRVGLWNPKEEGWRLTRLERAKAEHRPPRFLDFGDLVVLRREGDLRLQGVRPLTALRDEVELLLHTSPEAPYLGEQREAAERVSKLLRTDSPPR